MASFIFAAGVGAFWIRSYHVGDEVMRSSSKVLLANGLSYEIGRQQFLALHMRSKPGVRSIEAIFGYLLSSKEGVGLCFGRDSYRIQEDLGMYWYLVKSIHYLPPDATRSLWGRPFAPSLTRGGGNQS